MENQKELETKNLTFEQKVEYEKLKVERSKAKYELMKWLLLAIGAIISFYVIDIGKLNIERFTAEAANQEKLLNSYLVATESPNPDLWQRKLSLIKHFSKDSAILLWADREVKYINEKAALLALYKETLNVTSILANRQLYGTEEWQNASKRYYQLYWAELPFYGESPSVSSAMIAFKKQLDQIQTNKEVEKWEKMDFALIELSSTLREESENLKEK